MNLDQRILALANAMAADVKLMRNSVGTLSGLPTTAKNNLVASISEIYALVIANANGVKIDDAATNGANTVTWSADKIYDTIELAKQAVINTLTNGASAALDTFKELQDALGNDASFAQTMATTLSKKLDFTEAQVLTVSQKVIACTNLGIGDPDTDFVAYYNTQKA